MAPVLGKSRPGFIHVHTYMKEPVQHTAFSCLIGLVVDHSTVFLHHYAQNLERINTASALLPTRGTRRAR